MRTLQAAYSKEVMQEHDLLVYPVWSAQQTLRRYFAKKPNELFFDSQDEFRSEGEAFPYDDFPVEFDERTIRVESVRYDSRNIEDALGFAGVFGIEDLKPSDYENVLSDEREYFEMVMNRPPINDNELLDSFCAPLLQACPSCFCLNPDCLSYRSPKSVVPFCIVPNNPVAGLWLFEEYSEVQVIFEVCRECGIIIASNQSG